MTSRNNSRAWLPVLAFFAGGTLAQSAAAQGWVPERHVEFVAPAAAGSSMDNITRTVERLARESKLLPVSSAVVNRSGGEHTIAYHSLKQRAGDPHVLAVASQVLLTNHISGRQSISHADVTPISMLLAEHYIAIVHKDSPIKTGRDLVEALRRNPESISIAVGNLSQRLAVAMVLQAGEVDMKRVRIPVITGGKNALTVAGGHVDVGVTSIGQTMPLVSAGNLRVLAVSGPKRLGGLFAAAPTWAELGYEKATFVAWRGVIAPPGITPQQIAYWENLILQVAEHEELRTIAERHQWEIFYRNAADTRRFMDQEYPQLKKVMTEFGLLK
ncbi:MAG: hypothetical protein HW373_94 [Deltaproteobacteria bacterium]|nr:hypothetical protein [Deltaproteobacteria bacterium]